MFCPAAHTTPKKRTKNSGFYRFNFNGQERDDEVYGAGNAYSFEYRVYDPRLGRFLSVDPLTAKYASLNPYTFVANNPIVFVDKDGRDIGIRYKDENGKDQVFKFNGKNAKDAPTNSFVSSVIESYYVNVHSGAGDPTKQIVTDASIFVYVQESEYAYYSSANKTIFYNPLLGTLTDNGTVMSPATVFDHEADHALQHIKNNKEFNSGFNEVDPDYDNKEEKRVITGSEQKLALAKGEIAKGKVTRKNHGGYPVMTIEVDSNVIDYDATYKWYDKKIKSSPLDWNSFKIKVQEHEKKTSKTLVSNGKTPPTNGGK